MTDPPSSGLTSNNNEPPRLTFGPRMQALADSGGNASASLAVPYPVIQAFENARDIRPPANRTETPAQQSPSNADETDTPPQQSQDPAEITESQLRSLKITPTTMDLHPSDPLHSLTRLS
jgi:hypothetical protein